MQPQVFFDPDLKNGPTLVKGSAAAVYGWLLHNPSAQDVFLQIFDGLPKDIVLGVTKPVMSVPINQDDYEKELPSAGVLSQSNAPVVTHLEVKKGLTIAATLEPSGNTLVPLTVNLFFN